MTTDQDTSEDTKRQTAHCGHPECVQAVNDWIDAGRPDIPIERTGGLPTHLGDVMFYARRDWLADTYETAIAEGRPYTKEQREAYVMRDRARRAREWHAARRHARRRATAEAAATDEQ